MMAEISDIVTTTVEATRITNVLTRKEIVNVSTVLLLMAILKHIKSLLQTLPQLAAMGSHAAGTVKSKINL